MNWSYLSKLKAQTSVTINIMQVLVIERLK
jgi:hypothetical protein